MASRRVSVFTVLAMTVPAGAIVMVLVALAGSVLHAGGMGSPTSLGNWGAIGWAAASGLFGTSGLIAFYSGFATAPMSVVAPIAALVSTVLPVGIAVAQGEQLSSQVVTGALICLIAIVLVSLQATSRRAMRRSWSAVRGGWPPAGCAESGTAWWQVPRSGCSSSS